VRLLAALVCAAAALAAGCGSGSGPDLTVFAASSLTEVLPRIEPSARYAFAGSDSLATQIREGAGADVFAAASPAPADALYGEGLVERPQAFATNRLVLVVPRDDPAGIHAVSDLARPGVRLLVGAVGVPVGDYARAALASMGASDVLANVVSEEQDVKGIVAKVALGEADAGFVYATDAAAAADRVAVVELPPAAQPRIEYVITVVSGSKHAKAAAAFVRSVLSERGRAALAAAGFGLP
jgi:molybdate transport system substrate-binding protein